MSDGLKEKLNPFYLFYLIPFVLKCVDLAVTFITLKVVVTAREGNPFLTWLIHTSPVLASFVILSSLLFASYLLSRSWKEVVAKRISEKRFFSFLIVGYAVLIFPIFNNLWILWMNVL